jgi:hypothetical protein
VRVTDVNERIAKALGGCVEGKQCVCADYESSIDASMAVIRERWPDARVTLWEHATIAVPPFHDDWGPKTGGQSNEGETDAKRLAHALLAALEAEEDIPDDDEPMGGALNPEAWIR